MANKKPAPKPEPATRAITKPSSSANAQRLRALREQVNLQDILNPNLIKKAKDEYMASLPPRGYSDMITPTKYGGDFGSSAGRGFDAWFEKNYINNPNSPLSEQERLALQPYVGVPRYAIGSVGQRDASRRAEYDAILRQQMAQYQAQPQNYSQQQIPGAMTSGITQRQLLNPESGFNAALNAANIQNQFQDYASGVNNVMSGQQPISPKQNAANINQAMQTYQNLVGQGMANMQAQNMASQFGQPQQPKRNPSTPSFQSPRPFG